MSRSGGKSEVICVDVGSTVAAKAGADAPGGGISLCFCRRGCAAPAQKATTLNVPSRSTPCRYDCCRRNRSPLRQRKLVSDADLVAATALQAKPFSLAATKIRIGRGPRSRYDHCRRNFSPLHRFASLGLKSRITAAPRAFPGKSMQ